MRENKRMKKFMKLKQFVCKAASIAMCAMIIGTTVVSVNVKADTKATESTVALDTHCNTCCFTYKLF